MRLFTRVADWLTRIAGTGWAAAAVVLLTAAWLVAGPLVDFSRAWELSMVAGMPVLTLLAFVVLQHTQNRDSKATQLKLNELIHSLEGASNHLIGVEGMHDHDLARLEEHYIEHRDEEHPAIEGSEEGGESLVDGAMAEREA
jgi:low affinity Fe/Cu permease